MKCRELMRSDVHVCRKIEPKIEFRHMASSQALAELVRARVEQLQNRCRLTRAEVVVEHPEGHARHGGSVNVRLEISLPGTGAIVTREAHQDAYVAVRSVFDAARRQIQRVHGRRTAAFHVD